MKRILILFFGMTMANLAVSQNETDALRYSYLNYNGTARYTGLGGAMGALGADMSAISINPAGMGRYSRSDFSFSGNVTSTNTKALYNGNSTSENKGNFNISNIGAVFVKPISFSKPTMWRFVQFGITSSRTNDFHGESRIEGNHDNSMLQSYTNYLNTNAIGLDQLSDFYEGKAYDAYLLNYDTLSGVYSPWYSTDNINQSKTTTTRGAQYQTDLSFSGNYNGNLYVGGSLGFPRIRYSTSSVYREEFIGDTAFDLEDYTFDENITTEGNGFNMKLGVIYLPVKFLRLGLALHTPTWYSMNDQYNTTFVSNFTDDNFDTRTNSPEGSFDYRLTTPGRIVASTAFLYKKRGFISLEYEYVDYGNAKLRKASGTDGYNFSDENKVASDIYKGASIFKAGAEFRVSNHWTVRGGYAFYESPIKDEVSKIDASRTNISGGLGYKNRNFSLDFTYLRSQQKEESYLYDPALVDAASIDRTLSNFIVTAGFRF